MRSVGFAFAAVLVAGLAVQAQPPGTPGLPPAAPPAAPANDPVLDAHLDNWSRVMAAATNFSAKFELTRTESAFKKERKYTGSVLCMKPNFARLSSANVKDKNDFEAFICNGKSLFHYDWAGKTVTEIPLNAGDNDNLMLQFLAGMPAAVAKKRFSITQFNPADKNYVYFDIKPILPKDQGEFSHIRLAVFGPNVPPPFIKYLPAEVYLVKPNDDTERWKFTEHAIDVKNIGPQVFQYEQPKEKDWVFKKAPVGPAPGPMGPAKLPGGTGLPGGDGALKPPR